jgi:hypothetical protein
VKCGFFFGVQDILRVEDRWCVEGLKSFSGVLFEVFFGEDVFDFIIEIDVVDQVGVAREFEVFDQGFKFLSRELDFLGVKHISKLHSR